MLYRGKDVPQTPIHLLLLPLLTLTLTLLLGGMTHSYKTSAEAEITPKRVLEISEEFKMHPQKLKKSIKIVFTNT